MQPSLVKYCQAKQIMSWTLIAEWGYHFLGKLIVLCLVKIFPKLKYAERNAPCSQERALPCDREWLVLRGSPAFLHVKTEAEPDSEMCKSTTDKVRRRFRSPFLCSSTTPRHTCHNHRNFLSSVEFRNNKGPPFLVGPFLIFIVAVQAEFALM